MTRLLIWLVWCMLGFCMCLAGCSMEFTADHAEVRWGIRSPGEAAPAKVEVNIDADRSGSGSLEEKSVP